MVECHLIQTSRIISALSTLKIVKCVLLSSVFLKDPGYVGEDDELDEAIIPGRFESKSQAQSYLKDNFDSHIEAWKWSIGYV